MTTTKQQWAVIRTYAAGVHVGRLVRRKGAEVELAQAVRVWRWRGARTLHEMSLHGIEPASCGHSRVSEPVPSIVLTDAIEIIPCSAVVAKGIAGAGWAQ
jgi:hypothetical protein